MSNIFVSLPTPAANGPGTAVDMSAFGSLKTLTIEIPYVAAPANTFLAVQISNDAGAADWTTILTFQGDAERTIDIACHWMRTFVYNFRPGGAAPTVEVGGTDDGTLFATLVATAGNGSGAGVDVSAIGTFKTVQVSGAFEGIAVIEVSEDGGATYAQAMVFQQADQQSAVIAADFMRVTRYGQTILAGTPIINIAAVAGGGGGGGAVVTDGITIQGDGTIPDPIAILAVQHDESLTGDGSVADPLSVAASAGGQVFRYTVTGAEPDLSSIVISLPVAAADPNYNAIVTGGGLAFALTFDCPVGSYTTTQFTCNPSADVTAGDVLLCEIKKLT